VAKRHLIVLRGPDGEAEVHPMKEWLRQNPQHIPEGLDANDSTSYQLRRGLRKSGWELEELSDRVLLIKPENGDTSFADKLLGEETEEDEGSYDEKIEEAEEITFGLERDLQSAVRANIEQLESGLKIIDDGKERVTDAGRIDITAMDANGRIVVIELKAGVASPEVVTQILAYMGAIAEKENKPARRILVAGDFHKKVILAARAVSALELKKYSFQFKFESVK
jgi:hypothetical protein